MGVDIVIIDFVTTVSFYAVTLQPTPYFSRARLYPCALSYLLGNESIIRIQGVELWVISMA